MISFAKTTKLLKIAVSCEKYFYGNVKHIDVHRLIVRNMLSEDIQRE